jgi:hypothetical protein
MIGDHADAAVRHTEDRIGADDLRVHQTNCYRHPSGAWASAMPDPIHVGLWIPMVIVGGVSSELPGRTWTQRDAMQVAMAHLDCT